jgi:magnesium chelatase subunit H
MWPTRTSSRSSWASPRSTTISIRWAASTGRSSGPAASEASVYIGDQTRGSAKVRTLQEQIALETRSRTLNPKFFEGVLKHGHEGVRAIEAQVTNTLGWSATTGTVEPWVYQRISETFVLDDEMRRRLAELNPAASSKLANRLVEACERQFWTPDEDTLDALRRASEELEDNLEGIPAVAEAVA